MKISARVNTYNGWYEIKELKPLNFYGNIESAIFNKLNHKLGVKCLHILDEFIAIEENRLHDNNNSLVLIYININISNIKSIREFCMKHLHDEILVA